MAEIKAIDRGTVSRVCSGQVITELRTAVKELVENALVRRATRARAVRATPDPRAPRPPGPSQDAGATTVEVKLRDFGAALIEVTDNGSGVAEADYEGLTKKHYTSKISSFADVDGVKSYGFRCARARSARGGAKSLRQRASRASRGRSGEALSSLCELAGTFTVTTRREGQSVGAHLDFARNGDLRSRVCARLRPLRAPREQSPLATLRTRPPTIQTPVARPVGTTVSVANIFAVRAPPWHGLAPPRSDAHTLLVRPPKATARSAP